MAVELMMSYRNNEVFSSNKIEENAVEEAAASGLESVEKLIRLLSQRQNQYLQASSDNNSKVAMEIEMDCKAVTDMAVNKFKKVISLLGRPRTGHARFRRGPTSFPSYSLPTPQPQEVFVDKMEEKKQVPPVSAGSTRIYCPTPIQRLPPLPHHPHQHQHHHHHQSFGVVKKDTSSMSMSNSKTITFASSPQISASNSYVSSLTGDTDSKQQPSSSSAFQITNVSQISSAGRPPLCSSMKRKCSSLDEGGANKCSSSGRCHCSKRRSVLSFDHFLKAWFF